MLTCASSRQAIKKYINANNNITGMTEAAFNKHISRALEVGEGKVFEFPKGMYLLRGGTLLASLLTRSTHVFRNPVPR
jgi:hypothetical protein